MIIKKLILQNFISYCGKNEFQFSKGLNIILGENGEGKTAFYEAIEWLFSVSSVNLESLASKKAIAGIDVGEQIEVKVSMTSEQWGQKSVLTKSFHLQKLNDEKVETSNPKLIGSEESSDGSRKQVDGANLLDRLFPSEVRRYSMFKGESKLDIFDNTEALEILIKNFSFAAKYYEKYTSHSKALERRADKAVEQRSRQNKKIKAEYDKLLAARNDLTNSKTKVDILSRKTDKEITEIKKQIEDVRQYIKNSGELKTINDRIAHLKEKKSINDSRIDENYTQSLLDDNWILQRFGEVQEKFVAKVTSLEKAKRKLQAAFDREQGKRERDRQITEGMINDDVVPLPITVPGKAFSEEMLQDQICKVCNREAPIGSEAYKFMEARLNKYLESQKPQETEEQPPLFPHDYTKRLVVLSTEKEDDKSALQSIDSQIEERIEFNAKRKEESDKYEQNIYQAIQERERILSNSKLGEEDLGNALDKFNTWQEDLERNTERQAELKQESKNISSQLEEKIRRIEEIDSSHGGDYTIKTRNILRDIALIFDEAKTQQYDQFVQKLEQLSNKFFTRINNDAFTGEIIFVQNKVGGRISVEVELHENGKVFTRPNTSLATSKHIAILFAISHLASETMTENYPLIFDAPTSSFGITKTTQFLNLIEETAGQKILLLKDFIQTSTSGKLEIIKEFEEIKRAKAFWVRLERPFDANKLETINTEVISL